MIFKTVRFANVVLTGMMAGILACILFGMSPDQMSLCAYLEMQQSLIRAFNVAMPIVGMTAILLTMIMAFSVKADRPMFIALLVASACLICSGLITRFGNQPINALVMKWSIHDYPQDWEAFRGKWIRLHTIRTVASFAAFLIIVKIGFHRNG